MDKILRINMGADGGPKSKIEPLGAYAGLGGRAMTSAIVAKEVPPLCHPLAYNCTRASKRIAGSYVRPYIRGM
jgi:hypothetical protein